MSSPDYPLAVLPSHEMYQIAQIALFMADSLARHRAARARTTAQWAARQDLAGGRIAYDRALGHPRRSAVEELPRPIDVASYRAAREIVATGPREAQLVSLASIGRPGWAVVGRVPGIGPVGAMVGSRAVGEAIRAHIMTGRVEDLAPWAVTEHVLPQPKLPPTVDVAAFVEHLDPALERSRAVAAPLRGLDRRVDAAIQGRFRGVDLDAPFIPASPPDPAPAPSCTPGPMGPTAAATSPARPHPQTQSPTPTSAPSSPSPSPSRSPRPRPGPGPEPTAGHTQPAGHPQPGRPGQGPPPPRPQTNLLHGG